MNSLCQVKNTTNQESSSIISPQRNLCDEISSKIVAFRDEQGEWISRNCQHLQEGEVHYYGIHKNQQMCSSINSDPIVFTRQVYQKMKSEVLDNMRLPTDTKVIQVVGDSSAPFSQEGTMRAKEFLKEQLTKNCVVSYGYTGIRKNDGTRCVNAAVSDVVFENEIEGQVVANLVGYHTSTALKEWGNSGPDLRHYVIVYGDDERSQESGTLFGDDVITSDFFADSLLLLDGGAQSFRQACNALLLDQKITVLSGLRTPERTHLKEGILNTPYFVAAKFLKELSQLISEKKDIISETFLQEWYQNYFGPGKCYVGSPTNPNFSTKQQLLNDAWSLFINKKLYDKIESSINFK